MKECAPMLDTRALPSILDQPQTIPTVYTNSAITSAEKTQRNTHRAHGPIVSVSAPKITSSSAYNGIKTTASFTVTINSNIQLDNKTGKLSSKQTSHSAPESTKAITSVTARLVPHNTSASPMSNSGIDQQNLEPPVQTLSSIASNNNQNGLNKTQNQFTGVNNILADLQSSQPSATEDTIYDQYARATGRTDLPKTHVINEQSHPNIMVMDTNQPDFNGEKAAKLIKSNNPSVAIIMLKSNSTDQNLASTLSAMQKDLDQSRTSISNLQDLLVKNQQTVNNLQSNLITAYQNLASQQKSVAMNIPKLSKTDINMQPAQKVVNPTQYPQSNMYLTQAQNTLTDAEKAIAQYRSSQINRRNELYANDLAQKKRRNDRTLNISCPDGAIQNDKNISAMMIP